MNYIRSMSNVLGIYIGRSFIEISHKKSKRMAYSLNSIDSQFRSLLTPHQAELNEVAKIEIRTKLPWLVTERKIGSSPAFITTNGLESWLDMNLPMSPEHWSVELKKTASALQKEMIFGLSERTDASGQVVKVPPAEELEFLAEKLKMSEVTHVAIGFLHSYKNPENEKAAAIFFRSKGFTVYASHEYSSDNEERPRFWSAILNAYVDPFLKEKFELILKTLTELGVNAEKIHFAQTPLLQFLEGQRQWLNEKNYVSLGDKIKVPSAKPTIYCGLEDFEVLTPVPTNYRTLSSLGWVSAQSFTPATLQPSPFQRLETNFWGALDWSTNKADSEPGPICLGRGVHPTLMDAMASVYDLTQVDGLSERMNEKTNKKITDSFKAYAKSTHSDLTPSEELLKSAGIAWYSQISNWNEGKKVTLVGPLSKMAYQIFKQLKIESNFILADQKSDEEFYLADILTQDAGRD